MDTLNAAVSDVWHAHQEALVVGDLDLADRLEGLARLLEHEAEYVRNVEVHDMRRVGRRREAGHSYAWLIRCDAAVRALRRSRGLSLPDDTERRAVA